MPGRGIVYTKIQARGVLDGVPIPIVGFTINWELNGIPMANLALPTNPVLKAVLEQAAVVEGRSTLRIAVRKVDEWVSAGTDSPALQYAVPTAWTSIFDGYTTMPGIVSQIGAGALTLSGVHWLIDLDSGSMFSDTSHPTNPWSLTYSITTNPGENTVAGGPTTGLREFLYGGKDNPTAEAKADLWGNAIRPWFLDLAKIDTFGAESLGITPQESGEGRIVNLRALRALSRMPITEAPLELSPDISSAFVGMLFDFLEQAAGGSAAIPGMANSTMWNCLTGFLGPHLFLAIVPRVRDALVVPYVPAQQGILKRVNADEIWNSRLTGRQGLPIRAVAALHQGSYAGNGGETGGGSAADQIVGVYPGEVDGDLYSSADVSYDYFPEEIPADEMPGGNIADPGAAGGQVPKRSMSVRASSGPILVRPAPPWMIDPGASELALINLTTKKRPDAVNPGAAAPGGEQDRQDMARWELPGKDKIQGVLQRYARGIYLSEKFAGRKGDFTGPLRFDIAPGSSIAFRAQDNPAGPMLWRVGTVVRVSHEAWVGPDGGMNASTSFSLIAVRSEQANDDRSAYESAADHPYFTNLFVGSGFFDDFSSSG